jgi:hypothetical protein
MNKDNTTVLYGALVVSVDPNAFLGQQPMAITPSDHRPARPADARVFPIQLMVGPAASSAAKEADVPAWRDPSTFRGELLVHVTAGIILMIIGAITAHLVLGWH